MAGTEGADVAQLRRLSGQFNARGDDLRRIGAGLAAQLAGAPWQGGDAGAFRSRWCTAYHPTLVQVCQALHDAATVLAQNADEQERASAGAGGAAAGAPAVPVAANASSPPAGGTPLQVKDWWDSLRPAEQQAWLHDHPDLLGNLDGLPGAVRDAANRALLPQQLTAAQAYVAAHPDDAGAAQDLAGLQTLTRILAEKPAYQLLLLDASGHPLKAAVANGDVDTATRLIAHVPGTTADVAGMDGDLSRVNNLTVEALRQLHQHGDAGTVVGINWMGYDAPDDILSDSRRDATEDAAWENLEGLFGVGPGAGQSPYDLLDQDGGGTQDALNSRWAHEGAPAFARFGEGLRVNGGADVRIVADAHSYGAAVAGGAAMQTDAYDALVTSGGPGTFATDAAQLHLHDGLFVSEAQWRDQDYSSVLPVSGGIPHLDLGAAWDKVLDGGDVVPDIGAIDPQRRFGTDPSALPGAHVFDDGPVGADADHGPLVTPHGHSSYWDVATHSLYNDGAVVAGYPQEASYRRLGSAPSS